MPSGAATVLAVASSLPCSVVIGDPHVPTGSASSARWEFEAVPLGDAVDLASAWKGSKLLAAVAPVFLGPGKDSPVTHRTVPILTARVAPEFLELLGVDAVLGRTFRTAMAPQGCQNCVVLSNEIWKLQFKSAPGVITRLIVIDGGRGPSSEFCRQTSTCSRRTSLPGRCWIRRPPFSNFVERIGAVARMNSDASAARVEADLIDRSENAGYVFPASLLSVTSRKPTCAALWRRISRFLLLAVTCARIHCVRP